MRFFSSLSLVVTPIIVVSVASAQGTHPGLDEDALYGEPADCGEACGNFAFNYEIANPDDANYPTGLQGLSNPPGCFPAVPADPEISQAVFDELVAEINDQTDDLLDSHYANTDSYLVVNCEADSQTQGGEQCAACNTTESEYFVFFMDLAYSGQVTVTVGGVQYSCFTSVLVEVRIVASGFHGKCEEGYTEPY